MGKKTIIIQNVNKFFEEEQILKNINAEFEEGKIYGIVGMNGSGKQFFLSVSVVFFILHREAYG